MVFYFTENVLLGPSLGWASLFIIVFRTVKINQIWGRLWEMHLPSYRRNMHVHFAIDFKGSELSKLPSPVELRQRAPAPYKCVKCVFAHLFSKLSEFSESKFFKLQFKQPVHSFLQLPLTFSFVLRLLSECNRRKSPVFMQVFTGCLGCARNCGRCWWSNES